MSILSEISKQMAESKFCYRKEGGQGFVHQSQCTCTKDRPCQAEMDAKRFHTSFDDIEYGDIKKRNERIQQLKPKFKDSDWWKNNVIE